MAHAHPAGPFPAKQAPILFHGKLEVRYDESDMQRGGSQEQLLDRGDIDGVAHDVPSSILIGLRDGTGFIASAISGCNSDVAAFHLLDKMSRAEQAGKVAA